MAGIGSCNIVHTILLIGGLVLTAGVLGVVIAILVNESNNKGNNGTNTNTIYNETFVYNQTTVFNSTNSFNSTNVFNSTSVFNNTVIQVVNQTVYVDGASKVLNVAQPNKISPDNSKYQSYQEVVQMFKYVTVQ